LRAADGSPFFAKVNLMFDTPLSIILATIVAILLLRILFLLLLSGGDLERIRVTIKASFRILRDRAFADKVKLLLEPPPPPPPPKPSGEPLRVLARLQRDGRLVDFLLEDVSGAGDADLGAGVREIHRKCHESLHKHLALEPVLPQQEGETVEVPAGFDPSAIVLTGNVTGQPPFRGTLRHQGWRVKEIKLAAPPEGQDEFVLQPAEVELP
jgi:hypothetical protein